MRAKRHYLLIALLGLLVCASNSIALAAASVALAQIPSFTNVSVHDPSVVRDGAEAYVFGSHLASARTADWMHWVQISSDSVPGNPLVPDPQGEFAEALAWVGGNNALWAPDVIRLGDGRYYYYYCIGRLDQPRGALGIAVADSITGPYHNLGIILRSGMWGLPSPDGTIYDHTVHPYAVDPDVFFDKTGQLWMVYGSYAGGVFILELDPDTGFPFPGQGYGKKLIGGNDARIEGPFMLYSPESDYYYLFLSFGGFPSAKGYNIRVARSRQPDGPFFDAAGNDMTDVAGTPGTLFDDAAIAPYGVKLLGNYQFLPVAGEPSDTTQGYLSPGHNSAYRDPDTGRYFLIFHTRFVGRGEEHEVRVHQLYMNADGWLVAAPHRFAGETLQRYGMNNIPGDYKVINHGKAISADVNTSTVITLRPNGRIAGGGNGWWGLSGANNLALSLGGVVYQGVVTTQWDDDQGAWVYAFSAISVDGVALWGSRVVVGKQTPQPVVLQDQMALLGETLNVALPLPRENPHDVYSYAIEEGPDGLWIDRATGVLSWQPKLAQVDVPYPVSVLALDTSADNPRQTIYNFSLTALSENVVRRIDLDFRLAGIAGLRDRDGVFTGLSTRLPGTGGALPANDPNLHLDTANGVLELATTKADFLGQVGLATNSAPGIGLAELGFTGTEDFSVTAVFRPLTTLEYIDQVGVYVGADSATLTRAGAIVWATPERYSTHTQGGFDYDARFYGFGLDVSDGMVVTLEREAGLWHHYVDGVEWNPLSQANFLDGHSDLVAGVFAITPINNTLKTIEVDAYSLVVATDEPQLTPMEVWRIRNFGLLDPIGSAADNFDADNDGLTNKEEFDLGTDPLFPNP